jgi:hypothetical protein
MGVPGGSIGPTLFIGAMLGALFSGLADYLPLTPANQVGLFALLGMGAMMAGSLQAPLAALTAMLELTDNPKIILPGMLVVVISGLTAGEIFGKGSVFTTMLRSSGFKIGTDPLTQALRRIGVASVMERRIAQVGHKVSRERARELLQNGPRYLLVSTEGDAQVLMPSSNLSSYLDAKNGEPPQDPIDLLSIPAKRWNIATISLQANLQEASEALKQHVVEALVVKRHTASGIQRVYGILTPEMVENAYLQ